jgi:hypothetical protein
MGWRFHKRIRILPGVHINLSKSGVSTSIGDRGAELTFGNKGITKTIGIPGTGLYYTIKTGMHHTNASNTTQPDQDKFIAVVVLLIVAILYFFLH